VSELCGEMGIAHARPGEAFMLPSGEIVRAGEDPDALILVGMMGPFEIPFVMKRVGSEWKVFPQKYFEMLRAAGAL
jgi:hypothetical protein